MITVSGLSIYPVKSLGGVDVEHAALDRFGLQGDRRWMLVDGEGSFLTQRELAEMSLINAVCQGDALQLSRGQSMLTVRCPGAEANRRGVRVWGEEVSALDAGDQAASWCSDQLQVSVRLVYMSDDWERAVDEKFAKAGETVSFADGFPLLLISQASLDDFNGYLSRPVPMNRFRPNLVVSGCDPYAEDGWRAIRIGKTRFDVAKPCSRCVMPSIDQRTGQKDGEILSALATYRRGEDRKTYFGQNLLYRELGELALGDEVEVLA